MTAEQIAMAKLKLTEMTPELTLALAEAKQAIITWCNMGQDEDIPEALNFTWANMAVALAKGAEGSVDVTPAGPLVSTTQGDTSYSFGGNVGQTRQDRLDAVVNSYAYQLNKFRRLRWP